MTITAEPKSVMVSGAAPAIAPTGSIHIELPGRAVISVEAGVDPELVRAVLGSLLRVIEPKAGTRIWIAAGFTDLRRGLQGLSSIVETVLEQAPFSGTYTQDQKGEHPRRHLNSFAVVPQADAYAGFHHLYEGGRIVEAACWAHARRKFYDIHVAHGSAIAGEARARLRLSDLSRLFALPGLAVMIAFQ